MESFNMSEQKSILLGITKNKSGVYKIVNLLNNKTYVGSAKDIRSRLYIYYNEKRITSSNMAIYKALHKYGYINFEFKIIEYCDVKHLIKKEQIYIDKIKPEYNMLKIAGSSLGYKHTDETINKYRSRIVSSATRLNLSKAATKRNLDSLTKLKISNAHIGKVLEYSTKLKLSLSAKKKKVQVFNIITETVISYESITEAAKEIGVSRASINKSIKNKWKCKKIYIVKYV